MAKYLLRIEGVNLSNFVDDAQDLSTIRGGGLILLNAIRRLSSTLGTFEQVSTGASSGLFEVEVDSDKLCYVKNQVTKSLREDKKLKHATIMFDLIDSTDDFVRDKESLIALNRWRQMQSPSLAIPDYHKATGKICAISGIRPATMTLDLPEKPKSPVSESIKVRRSYGIEQKHEFYESKTEHQISRQFTNDFDELTSDTSRGNLHHKMAVIYIDGNAFGKVQHDNCKTRESQQKFDRTIQERRKGLL